MAAGAIVLAHKSGGPKMDIVDEGQTGFLAADIDSYATAMRHVLEMKSEERQQMRERARESVDRFSVSNFETKFMEPLEKMLHTEWDFIYLLLFCSFLYCLLRFCFTPGKQREWETVLNCY